MAKKILVVDDERHIVRLVEVNLTRAGYDIVTAYDGVEALESVKSDTPDMIVLDVMMTEMTEGFGVSRKIKMEEKLKDIPVIILTAIRKKEKLPWTFEPDANWLPVAKFLEKPISPEELLREIKKVTN